MIADLSSFLFLVIVQGTAAREDMVSYSLGAFAAGRGRPRRVPETTSGLGAREGDYEGRAGMGGKQTFTPPPPSRLRR